MWNIDFKCRELSPVMCYQATCQQQQQQQPPPSPPHTHSLTHSPSSRRMLLHCGLPEQAHSTAAPHTHTHTPSYTPSFCCRADGGTSRKPRIDVLYIQEGTFIKFNVILVICCWWRTKQTSKYMIQVLFICIYIPFLLFSS